LKKEDPWAVGRAACLAYLYAIDIIAKCINCIDVQVTQAAS
jgi:hypothetical protein